jgi:hypothetical protein
MQHQKPAVRFRPHSSHYASTNFLGASTLRQVQPGFDVLPQFTSEQALAHTGFFMVLFAQGGSNRGNLCRLIVRREKRRDPVELLSGLASHGFADHGG